MNWPAVALVLALTACADVNYQDAEPGAFRGSLFVMWVGEGGALGDGKFLYVPDPRDPLTFVSAKGGPEITPGMFYTDGGSIPKAAQMFQGFSPWGYAPAYVVHDWLFVAHHCNVDGTPSEDQAALKGMTFQRSAELIGEAIRTLVAEGRVRENDVAPAVITGTVAGPIARSLWDRKGACKDHEVLPEDAARARAALSGSGARMMKRSDDGSLVPIPPAVIVGKVDF